MRHPVAAWHWKQRIPMMLVMAPLLLVWWLFTVIKDGLVAAWNSDAHRVMAICIIAGFLGR